MSLPVPNLDDRTFHQLVEECRTRIARSCPEWTDLSPSDPGMVLLEVFAHLTEVMIFRLNRVPEKAYIEFLRLLGVSLLPPSSAGVELVFSLPRPRDVALTIPRGTRVTIERSEPGIEAPVFSTDAAVTIPAGITSVAVSAHHCEWVAGELAGVGSGQPGIRLRARRTPIVASLPDGSDLVVGVETPERQPDSRVPAREFEGKVFRIWREVEDFTAVGPEDPVYIADRQTGLITFAPALSRRSGDGTLAGPAPALAAVPPAGREIRLWYRTGGGAGGNVSAGRLTVLKDAIAGVTVVNPSAASGGKASETLDNALLRGPQEFHSLQRAVTARDFELLALRHGSVARSRAFTKAELWRYAAPGTVEVGLVPDIPPAERPAERVDAALIKARQSDSVLAEVRQLLEERRPLGAICLVTWVNCKQVSVSARVVVHREEDPEAVGPRVYRRLYSSISPMPSADDRPGGWPFGKPLRASDVYDLILGEPGVSYVSEVRLRVDDAPDSAVMAVCGDPFHAGLWYAASEGDFFRTSDDAVGWEKLGTFPDETLKVVRPHPLKPGRIALVSALPGTEGRHSVRLSPDCGESWDREVITAFPIQDVAWIERQGATFVLLASDQGLYELSLAPDASPLQVVVDPKDQGLGISAVAISVTGRGEATVLVAATSKRGVFLSESGGLPGTFQPFGLGENISLLEVEEDGPRRFLWAGTWAAGDEPGKGCFRRELYTAEENWTPCSEGWAAGSCLGLAFHPSGVYAASHRGGVLCLPPAIGEGAQRWETPDVNCGLPNRDKPRFERVEAVATKPASEVLLAGGPRGIFRRAASGRYVNVSSREFTEQVTLPASWLFCSGEHDLVFAHET